MRSLALPASFTSTHDTSGLSGFPAVDVFGAAGTPVLAPVSGRMVDVHMIPWNVKKRVGGETAYLQGDNGKTYFLTHLAGNVPSDVVQAGQQIGVVGTVPGGAWASHVHEGVYQGTYNPGGTSTVPYVPGSTSQTAEIPNATDPQLAGRIDEFLRGKGSPLAGQGATFVAAGAQNGVDPRLLVAISGGESGFGRHNFRPYNAWGYMAGDFHSYPEAINTIAAAIGRNYIGAGLATIPAIGAKWAPVGASNDPGNLNRNWVPTISRFYQELGGDPRTPVTTTEVPGVTATIASGITSTGTTPGPLPPAPPVYVNPNVPVATAPPTTDAATVPLAVGMSPTAGTAAPPAKIPKLKPGTIGKRLIDNAVAEGNAPIAPANVRSRAQVRSTQSAAADPADVPDALARVLAVNQGAAPDAIFTPSPAPAGTTDAPAVHLEASDATTLPDLPKVLQLAKMHALDSYAGFTTPSFHRFLETAEGRPAARHLHGQLGHGQALKAPRKRALLFFGKGSPSHSGISLGGDHFVHGTNGGRTIQVSSLRQEPYASSLLAIRG